MIDSDILTNVNRQSSTDEIPRTEWTDGTNAWRRHDHSKFIADYVTVILCMKYAKNVAINAALPLEAALQFSSQG